MLLADPRQVLTIAATWFEIAFIPWYLTMIVIMARSLRDPDTGELDRVTFWMIGLLVVGLLHTGWMIDDLRTITHSAERLAIRVIIDLVRTIVVTMFMWHLRFKELYDEWQINRRNGNE